MSKIVLINNKKNRHRLIELLITLLESLGYTYGLDASIEESLLEYHFALNPSIDENNFNMLSCIPHPCRKDDYYFQWDSVTKDDVLTALEIIGEGFFSYIGESKEESIKNVKESDNYVPYIHSIFQYDNIIINYEFNLDITDIILSLLCEEKERIKIDKNYKINHEEVIIPVILK